MSFPTNKRFSAPKDHHRPKTRFFFWGGDWVYYWSVTGRAIRNYLTNYLHDPSLFIGSSQSPAQNLVQTWYVIIVVDTSDNIYLFVLKDNTIIKHSKYQ